MTAYNREKYIAESIESVLAQTFRAFELIVVDDCSKDRTVEIARRYDDDPRVRVYVNERNLGDYPNRNRAADLASGKYLKYVDADDFMYPHGLGIMVENMGRFPEAGFGLMSLPQDEHRPYPFQLSGREAYRRHYFGQPVFGKAPLSTILRKEAFDAVGGFSGKRWVGDFELWHVLAARYPVVMMPGGMVWWRKHAEQQSQDNRNNITVRFEYSLIALQQLTSPHCPLLPLERDKALHYVRREQARTILGRMARGAPGLALQLWRRTDLNMSKLVRAAFSAIVNKEVATFL